MAPVGLSKEATGSPGLTVQPAKTAEEEWSWPIGELLTTRQQAQLTELLDNFKDIFAFSMKEMTTVPGVEFEIPVSDETPIFKHQYRLAHSEKEDLAQQVAERLKNGSNQTLYVAMGITHYHAPKEGRERRLDPEKGLRRLPGPQSGQYY